MVAPPPIPCHPNSLALTVFHVSEMLGKGGGGQGGKEEGGQQAPAHDRDNDEGKRVEIRPHPWQPPT